MDEGEYYNDHDDPIDDTDNPEDYNNEYEDEDDLSDEEYADDDDQVIHGLLYRCRCKWKGGLQCREVFDDEDSMTDHLLHDHKTAKWLVQLYRPV